MYEFCMWSAILEKCTEKKASVTWPPVSYKRNFFLAFAHHDDEDRDEPVVAALGCDADGLLAGPGALHLRPQVGVQHQSVAARRSHH